MAWAGEEMCVCVLVVWQKFGRDGPSDKVAVAMRFDAMCAEWIERERESERVRTCTPLLLSLCYAYTVCAAADDMSVLVCRCSIKVTREEGSSGSLGVVLIACPKTGYTATGSRPPTRVYRVTYPTIVMTITTVMRTTLQSASWRITITSSTHSCGSV